MKMMIMLNVLLPVSLIICSVSCMSWASVYSSITLGLCRNNQFMESLQTTTSKVGLEAKKEVIKVCKAWKKFVNHQEYSASNFQKTLQNLDRHFLKFIMENKLAKGPDGFDKVINLKRAFRYFVAGLPENIASELFQVNKKRKSKFMKPLVFNCSTDFNNLIHNKNATLSPYLVSHCPLNQDAMGNPTMPLRMQAQIQNKGGWFSGWGPAAKTQSATYILDMVFAPLDKNFVSFVPVEGDFRMVSWNYVSYDQGGQLKIEYADNETFIKSIANREALYIYRKDNESKQFEGTSIKTHPPKSFFSMSKQMLFGGLSTMKGYLESWRPSPLNIMIGAIVVGLMIGGIAFGNDISQMVTQSITTSPYLNNLLQLSVDDFLNMLNSHISVLNSIILTLLKIVSAVIKNINTSALTAIAQVLQAYIIRN